MQTIANTNASRPAPPMWNEAGWMRLSLPEAKGQRCSKSPVRIGLALGGNFARGIAHAGVLRVLEQHHIPIHCVTGISAGAIVAAAYASGAKIVHAGCSMRLGRLGLLGSLTMNCFLKRLLRTYRFEEMRIPLGVLPVAPIPDCFSQ
jgi:hypothetical protein